MIVKILYNYNFMMLQDVGNWFYESLLAWLVTCFILLGSLKLSKVRGERGLNSLQRLRGLILVTVAVEMFVAGVRSAFFLMYRLV